MLGDLDILNDKAAGKILGYRHKSLCISKVSSYNMDHIVSLKGISIKVNVKNWLNRSKQNQFMGCPQKFRNPFWWNETTF
jgi:PIN domain nuclease of toxin-antitoxin system